jgi:hypothetical protein
MMSNQVILWGTLIVPWLTVLFMPKEELKRYISAGLLSIILCIIVIETGIRYGWWAVLEFTFPLSVLPTYTYGLFPVIPIWLLKYTYGRFGLYMGIDTILNIIFAFLLLPWFGSRGIVDFDFTDGYIALMFESAIAVVLYRFQMWQEGIFVRSERSHFSASLQPVAAKPLDPGQEDEE